MVRGTSRSVTTALSRRLHFSILNNLVDSLTGQVVRVASSNLIEALVPSLTNSIVPVVALSLSHDPRGDYNCFYCREHEVYCMECERVSHKDAVMSEDANYFSNYYGDYYGQMYSKGQIFEDLYNATANRYETKY